MATPSLAMIPSAYADSKVYSVLPNNGDGDFTFNRDSSATRVGQNGLIQTVGYFGNELITNGTFDTDSDWVKGTGWTISNGVASSDGSQTSNSNLYQTVYTVGKVYKTKIKVTAINGTFKVFTGSGSASITITAVGEYEVLDKLADSSTVLYLQVTSGTTITIDNVSVVEVTGDQPRLNYDISNGVVQSCPSLLLEGASTNLVTYSEDFSNASWTKGQTTVTTNSIISPDGSLNADAVFETIDNNNHIIYDTENVNVSVEHNFSIFVKKLNRRYVGIQGFYSSTRGNIAFFDLDNGSLVYTFSEGSGYSISNAKIENYGNGWYRLSANFIAPDTAIYMGLCLADEQWSTGTAYDNTYIGDTTKGVYVWGAMLEQGSYPTSYIPTNGASQTRVAETCSKSGLTNYIGQTEGVMYFQTNSLLPSGTRSIALAYTSGSSYYQIYFTSSNEIRVDVNGSLLVISSSINVNILNKIAFAYKSGDNALYINGVLVASSGNATVPSSLNDFYLGNSLGNEQSGSYQDFKLYKTRLTNAQLQTLTTL